MESAESLRPFTDEQLRTLYYNHELEHVDEYVDEFLQVSRSSQLYVYDFSSVKYNSCVDRGKERDTQREVQRERYINRERERSSV